MLLMDDGLDKPYSNGITQSDYLKCMGNFDADDDYVSNSFASYRLNNPSLVREYQTNHTVLDFSGMERGADCTLTAPTDSIEEVEEDEEIIDTKTATTTTTRFNLSRRKYLDHTGARIVRKLPQEFFRNRLIEHFDILFQQRKIVWPKSNKTNTKVNRVIRGMI
jgi:hypothetical protein